ncbi:hypothetical protein CDL15_Pgr009031 [Punica granatum]|uniref:Uncharacterized protein n=1 Tax=Punica granatum TaxID=22663 RepID=A0A218VZJ5_PUNGR|nr:hypothetical protein CDL15_Pgr009031 [Punica granatum]
MEHSSKLVENLTSSQSLLLSDHFDHYQKSQSKIVETRSGTMHEFHGLDQLQVANISSPVPPFRAMQNPLLPEIPPENYGFNGTTIDLDFYENKPYVDTYGGGHGQVMDNFQGGGYLGNFTERTGSCMAGQYFNCQLDVKPMSFVAPDEISCISAENGYSYQNQYGTSKARALASSTARRACKSRTKSHVVKGQWTIEEDRLLVRLVEQFGVRKWSHIAQMLPGRIGKQCRERWHNHLRPDIKV